MPTSLLSDLKYIDISPEIREDLAVFPGDRPFRREISMDFAHGDNLMLSSVSTTVHLGAHVDGPNHYHQEGLGISERSLDYYIGPCQVIEVCLARGERIRPQHLPSIEISEKRVLFKTGSFPNPYLWNGDFNGLSRELVDFLAEKGVILVGIDTPSIDLADDKVLEAHQAVFKNNMAILEGIILDNVSEGVYSLIALPLRLAGLDASPVRAILVKDQ